MVNERLICLEERGRIGNGCSDSAVVKRLREIEKLADKGRGWELMMGGLIDSMATAGEDLRCSSLETRNA